MAVVCTKKSKSNMTELHSGILDFIFHRLSFKDVLRAEAVCSHWFSVAKQLISFKCRAQSYQIPWLLLPPEGDIDSGYSVFSVEANKVCELKNVPKESCCIGSSHSWLIFLDERAAPFLLNPYQQVKIQLPRLDSFLGIREIEKREDGEYCIKYDNERNIFSVSYMKHLRENLIHKSILLLDDHCFNIRSFTVAVIYGREAKLAYSKIGDSSSWTVLDGKYQPYHDILCIKNKLYALGSGNSIEVWDFDDGHTPTKKLDLQLSFPEKSLKLWRENRDLYTIRFYLVEILGEIMLAVRFIGEFVNGNDEPIREEDLLIDDDIHPLICPYKTLIFHVYKLDFVQKKWVEVDFLRDHALFLGGNHSVAVSAKYFEESKKNSIYFTDDYWERMNEDYLYGGHDMGVFSLEDQSVKPFYQCASLKIQPAPCWVAPSPWETK